jgi:hypothetical protein
MQLRKFASKLRVIVLLSIVLITGISLVPTLQIQGQVQQQQSPSSPGGSPSSGSTSPPPSPTTPPALDTADGRAANQTAMVMIPQSSVMTMLSNLQIAMNAVGDDEEAMMALESVDQELRSAAAAAGMSIGNTTDGGGGEEEG